MSRYAQILASAAIVTPALTLATSIIFHIKTNEIRAERSVMGYNRTSDRGLVDELMTMFDSPQYRSVPVADGSPPKEA